MNKELNFKSLVDILKKNGKQNHNGIGFINGNNSEKLLTYRDLYLNSLCILNTLQKSGIRKGDELILQVEDNEDFILIFWACLLGGIIPVPVTIGNNNEHKLKIFKIWNKLNNPYIISSQKVIVGLEQYANKNNLNLIKEVLDKSVLTDDNLISSSPGIEFTPTPQDIAFIQYSSGSTGDPKGVILTHENLLTNISQMINGSNMTDKETFLSWMPLTHDMGIIGMHLVPFALNAIHYFIPTTLFIRRPTLWFIKINEHKVTITSSPNFGYSYFLMHYKPEIASDWDLSHVRLIFNGAEPISSDLCNQFLKELSKYGLKKTTIFPVYGLAEASLGAAFPNLNEEFITVRLDRSSLKIGQKVRSSESNDCVSFVDVGYPLEGIEMRICNEKDETLEDCTIGYIQIKGKNVTSGYYNERKKSEETIRAGWLNTGDLGFMNNGRLVITGRGKDIIFVNGQNFYPHDIERVAEGLEDIKLGYIVACGVVNPKEQSDKTLLFVLYKKDLKNFIHLSKKLKKYISEQMGLDVYKVIPVKKIPKTTSGKFERYKLGKMYLDGEFTSVLNELNDLEKSQFTNVYNDELDATTYEAKNYIVPNSEIQEKLVTIVKKVFKVERIGINENFFDLGGNSLLLVQMHEKIEQLYPGKVTITDLFSYPTISKMAEYIENSDGDYKTIELTPIKFPAIFFSPEKNREEGAVFKYKLNESITNSIQNMCTDYKIGTNEFLLTTFLILLDKVSINEKITIQTIIENENVAQQLDISVDKNKDMLNVLKLINQKERNIQLLQTYSVKDILERKVNKGKEEVIPLFYANSKVSSKFRLLNVYDFILCSNNNQNEIDLDFQYDCKRLNKDNMKKLFNNYIRLVEIFVNHYIEETKGVLI
ncbi:non-ribosomal peptide synthetase [Bacillus sp. DE0042]|uniref:non-ribosomal peptide synthetase n=1 Tax=Bacillus sp. DE0042 TaxID=2584950 RepID=UPI00119D3F50|nr:non-ribosomal peptide synthetase [Bacillus sp. DE0042]